MAKCKRCGKLIDDKWDLCYTCNQEAQAEAPRETPHDRHLSIERQVAAKCAASVLQGHDSTEETTTRVFNVFLKLIRG